MDYKSWLNRELKVQYKVDEVLTTYWARVIAVKEDEEELMPELIVEFRGSKPARTWMMDYGAFSALYKNLYELGDYSPVFPKAFVYASDCVGEED